MLPPSHCAVRARELFARSLLEIDSDHGLMSAATAIAMHAFDDVTLPVVERQVDKLARQVQNGSPSGSFSARLAHLHEVLFVELGFAGNVDHYYNPLNCYLPAVLALRCGIPVTLALVYKLVGNRTGLDIVGINSPGHFLAAVRHGEELQLIDPFFHGQLLTDDEAIERLRQVFGKSWRPGPNRILVPASHRQWIARILDNLRSMFAQLDRIDDLLAMNELRRLLSGSKPAS